MASVEDRVKKIVSKQLGFDEKDIHPNSNFGDDLNADSLDLVELIMAFEEEFGQGEGTFEIPDEDAEKIITVQDAVDYLKAHGVKDE